MSDYFQILAREMETKKAFPESRDLETEDQKKSEDNHDNKDQYDIPVFKRRTMLSEEVENPIWLNVSETAKLCGVQDKTIRRALKTSAMIKYKITANRYLLDLRSVVLYFYSNKKRKNKLEQNGIGQYIKDWIP
ncbi:hypothetical protein GF382_02405 [Candidatus Falkowbacteria bacterium]|nr:hypothetical protein [Candidatus Falkowbacteria bacterium]